MTPVAEVPRGILVLFDTRLLRTRGRSASAHYIQDPKISKFQDFKISRFQDFKFGLAGLAELAAGWAGLAGLAGWLG